MKKFLVVILVLLAIAASAFAAFKIGYSMSKVETKESDVAEEVVTVEEKEEKEDEKVLENELSDFDVSFLKMESNKDNMIYSPLSIKYALKMLEEGTDGNSRTQITNAIGNYKPTLYKSGKNMSLANALFVRDSFEENMKSNYIDTLKDKYDAEIKYDSFKSADNMNKWVNEKTLEIIPTIAEDDDVKELDFALVNALAIDMDWNEKFLNLEELEAVKYSHECVVDEDVDYLYDYILTYVDNVSKEDFEKKTVSGMKIGAAINNYDIIKEIGEDKIKDTVSEQYRKYVKKEDFDEKHVIQGYLESEDTSDATINKYLEEFIPEYMSEIKENYHKVGATTEFSLYVDDDVKVFAKDLKEYDGTTLEYIGIMPINDSLDEYIEKVDASKINGYVSKLKDVSEYSNFKDGVVTIVDGYIPKFNFEYSLDLMEDLKKNDITDVFEEGKANLESMIEGDAYISTAIHKANIEFTQDGIKAAASTMIGGAGAGDPFNYLYEVPTEKIDLTFDKPYMFLIRDKETGDTWFVGNVYSPLEWSKDTSKNY